MDTDVTYEDKRIKNKEGYTLLHMILQRGRRDKSTMLCMGKAWEQDYYTCNSG